MNNPIQMINQIRQNPVQFLASRGLNVPQEIASDPNKIIQHLLSNGQISQQQYDNAIKMAQNLGYKG